jgi:general secretion pathway protein G
VTLIEILIVVAIIALVAGAASVAGIKAWESALRKSALTDARAIRAAVKAYWLQENGTVCPSMDELISTGMLDSDGRKTDPWGSSWKIECKEAEAYVTSAGRDKAFGNEDDILAPSR